MNDNTFKDIRNIIDTFQKSLQQHLPALEGEVDQIIASKCLDAQTIERTLDTLLSIAQIGVGRELFIKLLDYYKTIDSEGALFYWNEYDNDN